MATPLGLNWNLRCRFYCFYDNQLAITQMFYKTANVLGTSASDQDAAARLDSLFAPLIKPIIPSLANYTGVSVQIVAPVLQPLVTANANAGAGTDMTNPLPTQNCGILTKNTAAAGKGRKGRMYIPFPCSDHNTAASRPTAAYQTALANIALAVVTPTLTIGGGGNTVDLVPIVFNPRAPGRQTNIIGATVKPLWATQRRRGDYGRTNLPFP